MAHFPPELGGPLEALAGTTHLSEDILRASIDELWRLSFLEIGETSGVEDIQYYLHTLTRYFVFSELLNREVK
jgi:hypothetical protein